MGRFTTDGWQLPYLRVSLIMRRLETAMAVKGRRSGSPRLERERRNVERTWRRIVRAGWFN
jgi:hypothetical protein